MQEGDYSSVSYYQYPPNPNPNPTPNYNPTPPNHPTPPPPTYASAPPFATTTYSASDYPPYVSPYPPYPQNPDPVPTPPTAPSYNPTPIIPNPNPNPNPSPNLHSFTPSPVQPTPPFPPYDQHAPYQQQPPYYPPYDQHQTAPNYASSFPTNPNPSPYAHLSSSIASVNDKSYENNSKFDGVGGYFDEPSSRYGGGAAAAAGGYGRSQSDLGRLDLGRSDLGPDLYGKRPESVYGDRDGGYGYGDGVYAYQGNNKVEPYGARGTGPKSSTWLGFDDFGRPVSFPSGKDHRSSPAKVVRAVPKADTQQDVKSGVQKFRVKLLAESGGQSTMDVLCQIGLDGIRMLDPSTSRTLRIYPLEQVTRFEVFDPSTFAFWSKSSVDIEPRRIRLQSNSYTTSTILDIVTAATVQLKEIGGRSKPSDSLKSTEQPAEKKKGLADWMNLMKPGSEEKDHWVPDEAVAKCTACAADFNAFVRRACLFSLLIDLSVCFFCRLCFRWEALPFFNRLSLMSFLRFQHHCRNCGDIFCDKCTHGRIALTAEENAQPVRVCDRCMAEVTQRLSNAKEAASKSVGLQSHEDLAKKLQEEMERNRKPSSGFRSDGSSGRRMKEVACPTCTVHLQV
ncbi:hypothetical protein RHGRI_015913 [Rhododendron griersonianum]|uniref:FYVE-type domain-containing protein n=1 Tax=Rhododendron griersonianum TaxID=479676 RepID=A0AAV6JQI7_9ERIC|nr:hypothetical protein RHGRI_015913 [Rhododendron griersonianum]